MGSHCHLLYFADHAFPPVLCLLRAGAQWSLCMHTLFPFTQILRWLLTQSPGIQCVTNFYQAITVTVTSGLMLTLSTAELLLHAVVGSMLEHLDVESVISEVGHIVTQWILKINKNINDLACELHEKLLLRNESVKVTIENKYLLA